MKNSHNNLLKTLCIYKVYYFNKCIFHQNKYSFCDENIITHLFLLKSESSMQFPLKAGKKLLSFHRTVDYLDSRKITAIVA